MQKGQNIFLNAIDMVKEKNDCHSYIYESCGDDKELLDYVLNLLKAHQSSDQYFDELESSITSSHLNEIEDHLFRDIDFGHYQILNVLKQGGMGTIFLARRCDGEFERKVVIKMLPIDLISEQSQSQFAHEKEILASLLHPNIVQLYDSGITKNGQSYFVMELVKGKTIIKHCNDNQLSIKQRLALFHKILAAVGYAHQHLVIHGDIKPSNIMVNDDNQVKLLDFGIAKLVTQQDAKLEGYSLAYLTPEHQSKTPINTTSDIHQLGQLLFEMLVGVAPRKAKIRKIETHSFNFPLLSQTFDDFDDAMKTQLIKNTGEKNASLTKQLGSDLNYIVAKALNKSQSQRYRAVQAFEDDLLRFEQGLCIEAREHSFVYRLSKYIKRNKLLTTFVMSLFFIGIVFLFIINQHNKTLAVERDKAIKSKELLLDVFTAADPSFSPGKELTATEVLDIGLQKVREKFKQPSIIEAEFLEQIAQTYQSLGQYQKALRILEDAFEIRQQFQADEHKIIIKSMLMLGENFRLTSNYKQAELWLNKCIDLLNNENGSSFYVELMASAKGKLGRVEVLKGNLDIAEKHLNESIQLTKQLYGEQHIEYAQALNDLNSVYFRQGKYDQVQKLLLTTKLIRENNWPEDNTGPILDKDYATNINNLGLANYLQGNLIEGEKYFRQAQQLRNLIYSKPHPEQAQSLTNLGLLLNDAGRPNEALPYLQQALEIRQLTLSKEHMRINDAWNNLAMVFHENKEFSKAIEIYQKIYNPILKIRGESHPQSSSLYTNMANTYLELNAFKKAHTYFQKSLDNRLQTLPEKHLYLSYSYIGLGRAEIALGNITIGKSHIEKGLTIRQEKLPKDHWLLGEAYYAMAMVNYIEGLADKELTKKACEILRNKKGEENILTQKCLTLLQKVTDKMP